MVDPGAVSIDKEQVAACDETGMAIIPHLREGRKAYGAIARELGVTENTVRARVKKLTPEYLFSSDTLRISADFKPHFNRFKPGLII